MQTTLRLTSLALALSLFGCPSGNKYSDLAKQANSARDAGGEVKPQPPEATLLTSGQNVPRDLHVDGDNLYWLNEGIRTEGKPGVFKMNKAGGEVVTLTEARGVYAIAVDADNVYYLVPEALELRKVPKSGGKSEVLASNVEQLRAMTLDADSVYFAGSQGIFKVAKAGGPMKEVALEVQLPDVLGSDDAFLYWYSQMSGKVARLAKRGGSPKAVVSDDLHTLHTFFIDGNEIFFSYGSEKKMEIHRTGKAGGKIATVVSGQDPATDFAVDATHIFWSTGEQIFKAPRSGGEAVKVVDKMDRAADVEVDGQYVYWTDRIGRIERMPK
jgi:hypothetical protein